LPECSDRAEENAADECDQDRNAAELDRIGQGLADQFGDGVVLVDEARTEIAGDGIADIAQILADQRLIEFVCGHDVGHRLGRQRALKIEGAAGRKPHQKE
jgi:hypothetical protein